MNDSTHIKLLNQILPFILKIKNKTIVIKYGGSAMKDPQLTQQVVENITLLIKFGINIIIVHGGGPIINYWLEKSQIEPKFHNGLRITDPDTMEIVEMVLVGKVNKNLVTLLNKHNCKAIGLSGKDANLIIANPLEPNSNSRVGQVQFINIELINLLIRNNYTPIISPVASSITGLSYNINADTVAGEIARALNAEMLIMLTDTPGILLDPKDLSSIINHLKKDKVLELINNKVIQGGMLPKVESCIKALSEGVNCVKIIDGRVPNSILISLLIDNNFGTSITI
uniref:Acetylglutamate kinase n=1 Tax=Dichotomaria marginata TaxID=268567 RepID=A0A1G4NSY7_9FLOR|nr:Acetylglutamate kinase [Dichotomaria marginata]SCW21629.1 Acetylglutamate kinase [Dichotomaria marginata]